MRAKNLRARRGRLTIGAARRRQPRPAPPSGQGSRRAVPRPRRQRRQHHRLAERHLRRRDAGHDLPQVARRHQGALREGLPRLEGHLQADADQQRPVHGADHGRLRVEGRAGRDADLLGRLHHALHAELAAAAEHVRRQDARASTRARASGTSPAQPRLQERQGRDLRGPERRRHVRALLQQGALQEGRRREAADDLRAAARRLHQVQGRRTSSRSPTATATATRPTTG